MSDVAEGYAERTKMLAVQRCKELICCVQVEIDEKNALIRPRQYHNKNETDRKDTYMIIELIFHKRFYRQG